MWSRVRYVRIIGTKEGMMAEGNVPMPIGISEGSLTKVNDNITSVERAYYRKFGKVVVVNLMFTVGTTITENVSDLFSGLPKPNDSYNQSIIVASNNNNKAQITVSSAGNIVGWYTIGNIQPGIYVCTITYICA